MTPREIGMLLAYVAGACPSQKMNDFTPDAWHDILGHLEFAECRAAVRAVCARQPFISPSEIIAEIAAQRSSERPHSEACRSGGCRDCKFGAGDRAWCMCVCHPRAVKVLAGPPPGPPALPAGQRRYEQGALQIGRDADS